MHRFPTFAVTGGAPQRQNAGADGSEHGVSVRQLAHELNSLLDGSLRTVAQVQQALDAGGTCEQCVSPENAARLRTAHEAMQHMARLLGRAMISPHPDLRLFDDRQPIERRVKQIVADLHPLADEHQVRLSVDLTPRCSSIGVGTLGPVILNGLRNAIEACAGSAGRERRVELSIAVNTRDELVLSIADTGAGASVNRADSSDKPNGHGLGLELSAQIVGALNGELRLTNIPFGGGAILHVVVPLRSLVR